MKSGVARGLVTLWALLGVSGLFAWAVVRLGSRGIDTVRGGLEPGEWVVGVLLVVGLAYGEGLEALDRRWVPKLVERVRRLRDDPRWLLWMLAPFYGLALIGGGRKELLRGWIGTSAVVTAVLIVRTFPEPWRGIVDLGVAAALAWGMMAIFRRLPAEMGA